MSDQPPVEQTDALDLDAQLDALLADLEQESPQTADQEPAPPAEPRESARVPSHGGKSSDSASNRVDGDTALSPGRDLDAAADRRATTPGSDSAAELVPAPSTDDDPQPRASETLQPVDEPEALPLVAPASNTQVDDPDNNGSPPLPGDHVTEAGLDQDGIDEIQRTLSTEVPASNLSTADQVNDSPEIASEEIPEQAGMIDEVPVDAGANTDVPSSLSTAGPDEAALTEPSAVVADTDEHFTNGEDLAAQLQDLLDQPTEEDATQHPTEASPLQEDTQPPASSPETASDSDTFTNGEDLAAQLQDLLDQPAEEDATQHPTEASPLQEDTQPPASSPETTSDSDTFTNGEDLAAQLQDLLDQPTENPQADGEAEPESTLQTAVDTEVSEASSEANDLTAQLQDLLDQVDQPAAGSSNGSGSSEANENAATLSPSSKDSGAASQLVEEEKEEDLAAQIQNLFDVVDQSDTPSVDTDRSITTSDPDPAESTPTGHEPSNNSSASNDKEDVTLDQIDQLLATQAEHTLAGDFETTDDAANSDTIDASAAIAEEESHASEPEDPALDESLLCADDTSLRDPGPTSREPSQFEDEPMESADAQAVADEIDQDAQANIQSRRTSPAQATPSSGSALRVSESALRSHIVEAIESVSRRALAALNRPFAKLSPPVRDTIGYFALLHLFIGTVLICGKLLALF